VRVRIDLQVVPVPLPANRHAPDDVEVSGKRRIAENTQRQDERTNPDHTAYRFLQHI